MEITVGKSDRGFPNASWVQSVPFRTKGSVTLVWWALGCAVAGAVLGGFAMGGAGAVGGVILGLLFASKIFNNSMKDPKQQKWAAEPALKKCDAGAFVTSGLHGPVFHWSFLTPNGGTVEGSIPFADLNSFESGAFNDWFGAMHNIEPSSNAYVIVVHADDGPKCIAVHAGSKAEIAQLHAVLTREFITRRSEFSSTAQAAPPRAAPLAAPLARGKSDDLPKSL